jgi:hypothetical protein
MTGRNEQPADDRKGDPQTRREEVELDLMEAHASEAGEHLEGVADDIETDDGS